MLNKEIQDDSDHDTADVHTDPDSVDHSTSSSDPPQSTPSTSPSRTIPSTPPPLTAAAPQITLEDRLSQLRHALSLTEAERESLASSLKTARRDAQKADAALRSEMDILKRASEKSAAGEHRAKQKILALQEAVKRAQAATRETEEMVKELEEQLPGLLKQKSAKEKDNNIIIITKRISSPSGMIWDTEKNLINEKEIFDNSIICHNPPNKAGIIIIRFKYSFRKSKGFLIFSNIVLYISIIANLRINLIN